MMIDLEGLEGLEIVSGYGERRHKEKREIEHETDRSIDKIR